MGADPLEEGARSQVIRAFFGLPQPEVRRAALKPYIAACAAAAPAFRWTPVDNLHLTVRFVGRVERDLVDGVAERLSRVAPPGFELALGDVGTFRRGRQVRVVWIGLRLGADAVARLAARVDAECVSAGLAAEERVFTPHLTLARARHRDGAVLPDLPPAPVLEPWSADELVLYASHLSRAGAVYERLRGIRLAGQ